MLNRQRLLRVAAIGTLAALVAGDRAVASSWVDAGPDGGAVPAVAVDASGVAFAGTADGVFKRARDAERWEAAGLDGVWVRFLASDPVTPGVIWATTNSSLVYLTDDGGLTWRMLNAVGGGVIVVDPVDPASVYLPAGNYVLRTRDRGATWTFADVGGTITSRHGLAIDPNDRRRLYALTEGDGVLLSPDAGDTWVPLPLDLPPHTQSAPPGRAGTIIVTDGALVVGTDQGIFRTQDSGTTWDMVHSRAALAFAMPPGQTSEVFASTADGLVRSADGGVTWGPVSPFVAFALAFDPACPNFVVAGTALGPQHSVDGGASWVEAVLGIQRAGIVALALDPTEPDTIYAGEDVGGLFKSGDGGRSWSNVLTASDSSYLRIWDIRVASSGTVFAATSSGVHRSADRGRSWEAVLETNALALAVAPSQPMIVYAGSNEGLRRSDDGGATWGAPSLGWTVRDIAIDPADPDHAFLAWVGGVTETTDGGVTFDDALDRSSGSQVRWVAMDPPVLLASLGSQMYRSADLGGSWTEVDLGPGRLTTSMAVRDGDPTVYVGTSEGDVLRTEDGGLTWTPAAPVAGRWVHSLAVHPYRPGAFYVGRGRSVSILHPCDATPRPTCSSSPLRRGSRLIMPGPGGTDGRRVEWRWRGRAADGDFGSPLAGTNYALCVYAGAPTRERLVLGASTIVTPACSDVPCWTAVPRGHTWDGPPDGGAVMDSLILERRKRRGSRIRAMVDASAQALGPLSAPMLPLEQPVSVQVQSDQGACWAARYAGREIRRNDTGVLEARGR